MAGTGWPDHKEGEHSAGVFGDLPSEVPPTILTLLFNGTTGLSSSQEHGLYMILTWKRQKQFLTPSRCAVLCPLYILSILLMLSVHQWDHDSPYEPHYTSMDPC